MPPVDYGCCWVLDTVFEESFPGFKSIKFREPIFAPLPEEPFGAIGVLAVRVTGIETVPLG